MTLNAKIGGFMDFWRFQAATQVYIIHKVASRYYRYAIQIENLVFVYSLSINRNCYWLSRVSWALAQIFCLNFCRGIFARLRSPFASRSFRGAASQMSKKTSFSLSFISVGCIVHRASVLNL